MRRRAPVATGTGGSSGARTVRPGRSDRQARVSLTLGSMMPRVLDASPLAKRRGRGKLGDLHHLYITKTSIRNHDDAYVAYPSYDFCHCTDDLVFLLVSEFTFA